MSVYVCGLTVYDVPHLGHGRMALVFDVLRRFLEFRGLEVRFVSNITDIDDNIINRASEEGRSEAEVAAEYEAVWWDAVDALGVKRPTETPHATAFVADMVALIAALVDGGVAYETSDGVYLAVDEIDGYGLLARQSLDSLRAGRRVEPGEEKRSPFDFVLWKKARPGEPTWDSPWGPGRPGWHTECVVMSLDLLGEGFDLHGGGLDLAFPHHENERAQAVGLGKAFARHWVHNGWVMVEGEKMSKSLGNFTSPHRPPRTCRRPRLPAPGAAGPLPLAHRGDAVHRRAGRAGPLPASTTWHDDSTSPPPPHVTASTRSEAGADPDAVTSFVDAHGRRPRHPRCPGRHLRPRPPGQLGRRCRRRRRRAGAGANRGDPVRRARPRPRGHRAGCGPRAAALVAERDATRAAGDYDRADAIRAELEEHGWVVEDGPDGTRLHRRPGA